MKCGQPQQG
uniref:Uncharacterized protein n=1 Tax=Anguilla anguilla TaxID=7936 RepID=A0A0E9RN61_ANGAN